MFYSLCLSVLLFPLDMVVVVVYAISVRGRRPGSIQ